MHLETAYFLMLLTSLGVMLAQLFVQHKRLEHIFFAIFCGSIAMVAVKHLGSDILGPYRYIVGLFTSATCNFMWLISRAMFRGETSIQIQHWMLALSITLLVMCGQGLRFATEISWLATSDAVYFQGMLNEITALLSSTVLVLTFWEAVRPNSVSQNKHRYVFATAYALGVFLCTDGISAFPESANRDIIFSWFVVVSATTILFTTQVVQYWQMKARQAEKQSAPIQVVPFPDETTEIDSEVVSGLAQLMESEKPFLQHNLKTIDLANSLGVSEYKISRAIRYHFKARNFNQFINDYRIEHAKYLLCDQQNQHWSVLVIGLESGFSSVASFNRVFKATAGCTPNSYRMRSSQAKHAVS